MDLLPANFDEFRSKEYWDQFFQKRKNVPFEWYGEWDELKGLITSCCHAKDDVLMAGCGNSELSACMYDFGYQSLVNIDFSKVCITEMLKKNVRARPKMRWLVMDMTKTNFKDEAYDVVLDKGGLDALMGEENAGALQAGTRLLAEVKRLLRPGGRYLCVTLGQEHVAGALVRSFREGWDLTFHRVPLASKEAASSSLKPMLAIATRARLSRKDAVKFSPGGAPGGGPAAPKLGLQDADEDADGASGRFPPALSPVEVTFSRTGWGQFDPEQLKALVGVIDAENAFRRDVIKRWHASPSPSPSPYAADPHHSQRRSEPHASPPGGLQDLSIAADGGPGELAGGGFASLDPGRRTERQLAGGRYLAVVLDSKEGAMQSLPCAVFLVPQGREHEWLFAAEEGQWQLVESARAARLILIRLNRGHTFGSSADVQAELSPLVLPLAPDSCQDNKVQIPYMTTGDGVGKRIIVEEVDSPLTGGIIVEDVELASQEPPGGGGGGASAGLRIFRRLVFKRNPNLVQSEAALLFPLPPALPPASSAAAASPSATVHSKKGPGGPGSTAARATQLAGATGGDQASTGAGSEGASPEGESTLNRSSLIDHSYLTSDYHAGIVAGLALIGPAIARALDAHAPVVELDAEVAALAKKHFGFRETPRMQLSVGDGVEAVEAMAVRLRASTEGTEEGEEGKAPAGSEGKGVAPEATLGGTAGRVGASGDRRMHLIVVDADSGDTSLGMSCPPAVFLQGEFLRAARVALHEDGVLAVNVVARAAAPYAAAKAALFSVFEEVYEMDVDEDVNKVLFALPRRGATVLDLPGGLAMAAESVEAIAGRFAPWRRGPSLHEHS
eukprot:jgi/Mesen1/5371/ME000268S04572